MKTPVYVKLNAPEQLLLSQGVCLQLRIITYHPEVCKREQPGGNGEVSGSLKERRGGAEMQPTTPDPLRETTP